MDQMRNALQIWSHLLKRSLMENFIFCAISHCSSCDRYVTKFEFIGQFSYEENKIRLNFNFLIELFWLFKIFWY